MQKYVLRLTAAFLASGWSFSRAATIQSRIETGGFQDPAKEFRPKFRYWLPDASATIDTIKNDVADLAAVGAGGLEFLGYYLYGLPGVGGSNVTTPTNWSTYGFGTPAFNEVLTAALQGAKDSKLLMDIAVGPNQGAGVPAVPGTLGLSFELLVGNLSIESGKLFTGAVPLPQQPSENILSGLGFQHPLEQFGSPNLIAVTAFEVTSSYFLNVSIPFLNSSVSVPAIGLNESSYVDLTPLISDNSLNWTVPGRNSTWRIFSFWEHYTNQRSNIGGTSAITFIGNGSWTVDHFSKAGAMVTTDFWDNYILTNETTADLLKSVGNYAWEDSMEILAALYWTPNLLERFEKDHGYSLVKYLPLLYTISNSWNGLLAPYPEQFVYGDYAADGTSLHSLDYRTTLNKGYQDYMSHFMNWSHSKGLKYSNQPAYNLPLQMFSDVPLVDAPECESLGWADDIDSYRQFSGPAHLAGNSVISNELGAVNTAAYSMTIPELLFHAKRAFSGGINMIVFHGFPYSGNYPNTTWPGYTTFNYSYTDMWNRMQPCWQHMKDTLDYVGRNQYVLQQGVPRVDLAFYLYESPYTVTRQYPSTNLQNLGYSYDYLGPDNLLGPHATVSNGTLASSGPAYKALIFSSAASVAVSQSIISAKVLQTVAQFAATGLPVIFIGRPSYRSTSTNDTQQEQFDVFMGDLLSSDNVYVVSTVDDLPGILTSIGVTPRNSLHCSEGSIYSVWRSDIKQGTDYVFFYNDNSLDITCLANLAVPTSTTPYIYDAWTGTQRPLLQYSQTDTSLSVAVRLRANQTMIIGLENDLRSVVPKNSIAATSDGVVSAKWLDTGEVSVNLLGPATINFTSGRTLNLNPIVPAPETRLQDWNISIEAWHAPEDIFLIETAVTIYNFSSDHLVPWSSLGSDFLSVSGVGRYITNFTVPTILNDTYTVGGILSLGPVIHTMRAFISGEQLAAIDPSNPTVDISDKIQPGQTYTLMIEVTSTLFNRIKYTANSTMMWGVAAIELQPLYGELPFQGHGLIGPVSIQWTSCRNISIEGST